MKRLLLAKWIALVALLLAASSPALATACGISTVGGSSDFQSGVEIAGATCVPSGSATVNTLNVYLKFASGNFNCALYDSNGTGGKPGTKLCNGSSTAAAVGWVSVTPSSCGTLTSGHTYWISCNMSSSAYASTTGQPSGTSYKGNAETCCSAMGTVVPNTNALTSSYSMYADITTASPPSAPTITPSTGTYPFAMSVSMSCSDTIYYTTDGSTPTHSSSTYSAAFDSASSGTETVKAICSNANGDSSVASSVLTISNPSDVAIISDHFNYVDANFAAQGSQQYPLDSFWTSGKWKLDQAITQTNFYATDTVFPAVDVTDCTATTSGYCVSAVSKQSATYTGRTGLSNNKFCKVNIPSVSLYANSKAGCTIDSPGTGVVQDYALLCGLGSGNGSIELSRNNGSVVIASTTSATIAGGSSCELRQYGSYLQVLVNGSVPSGLAPNYVDATYTGGSCGVIGNGGFVSDFSCGNVGDADSTSPASYTPTYGSYSDAMNTSGWTPAWPWLQGTLNAGPGVVFASTLLPIAIPGGTYGAGNGADVTARYEYRAPFTTDQHAQVTYETDPCNPQFDNTFSPLQQQNWIPGYANGGCSAAGTTSSCFDPVGIYPGEECMQNEVADGTAKATACGIKSEYCGLPFEHVTKVSDAVPNTTDSTSPAYCGGTRPSPDVGCDRVLTVVGSFWTPQPKDKKYYQFYQGNVKLFCKSHGSNPSWAASTAVSAATSTVAGYVITDPNGHLQQVILGGTTGSTVPTFSSAWGATIASPTVTPNVSAAATETYTVVAYDGTFPLAESLGTTITNAPTTLDSTHYDTLGTVAWPGSTTCKLWRTTSANGGALNHGLIGSTTCGSALVDNGLAGDGTSPPPDLIKYTGETTVDGTAVWQYYGEPCETYPLAGNGFRLVMDAYEPDFLLHLGRPALWIAVRPGTHTEPAVYSNFSAGSGIDATIDTLDGEQPHAWLPF